MRPYIFRGRTMTGRWVAGFYSKKYDTGKSYITVSKDLDAGKSYIKVSSGPYDFEVDDRTVGIYTHRDDIHGTPIYEGDIIYHERQIGIVPDDEIGPVPGYDYDELYEGEKRKIVRIGVCRMLPSLGFILSGIIRERWKNPVYGHIEWRHYSKYNGPVTRTGDFAEVIGNIYDDPKLHGIITFTIPSWHNGKYYSADPEVVEIAERYIPGVVLLKETPWSLKNG